MAAVRLVCDCVAKNKKGRHSQVQSVTRLIKFSCQHLGHLSPSKVIDFLKADAIAG